jgi:hypothetical protein
MQRTIILCHALCQGALEYASVWGNVRQAFKHHGCKRVPVGCLAKLLIEQYRIGTANQWINKLPSKAATLKLPKLKAIRIDKMRTAI